MDQAKLAKMQQSVRIGELLRISDVFNLASDTGNAQLTQLLHLGQVSLRSSLGLPSPVSDKNVMSG